MNEPCQIQVNGRIVRVRPGTTVAAAIAGTATSIFHRSPLGTPRGPLCGMGVCMECRVTIDGRKHARSCITVCRDGMEVWTDE